MALRTQIAATFYATVLNTEHFAETVTFAPLDGSLARSIVVKIEVVDNLLSGGPGVEGVEEITVALGRDQTHAKGGVDRPVVGDSITRADGLAYGYTGRVLFQTPYSWHLVFSRRSNDQVGRGGRGS